MKPMLARGELRCIGATTTDEYRKLILSKDAAVELSHRRIRGRHLPDKAIDVLDEACCLATDRCAPEVSLDHVEAVVRRWAGPARGGPGARIAEWLRSRL